MHGTIYYGLSLFIIKNQNRYKELNPCYIKIIKLLRILIQPWKIVTLK